MLGHDTSPERAGWPLYSCFSGHQELSVRSLSAAVRAVLRDPGQYLALLSPSFGCTVKWL